MIQRIALLLFCVGVASVMLLSLLPGSAMPALDIWDKAEHSAAYAAIAFCGSLALRRPHRWLVVGLFLLGGCLEVGQLFVPGRNFDLFDMLANLCGAAVGVILARLFAAALVAWMPMLRGNRA